MWTFQQSTGEIRHDSEPVCGTGYAGNGAGLNNPAMQSVKGVGPLPCGRYTIGPTQPVHGHLGVNVASLVPHPSNEMFGRGDFFLHGRKSPGDMGASEGCIVQDHMARMQVLNSADKDLEVVP